MINIYSRLKEIREKNNITINEMAEMLDVHRVTYYKYETGERSIPNDIAYKICGILNVTYDDIFLPTRVTIRNKKTC